MPIKVDAESRLNGTMPKVDDVERVLRDMVHAVADEHHDYRNRRHVEVTELLAGRASGQEGDYRFRKILPRMLAHSPGTTVRVEFQDGDVHYARVGSQNLETIVLRLPEWTHPTTPPASISWDPAWLLEELRKNLSRCGLGPLAQALVGLAGVGPPVEKDLLLSHAALTGAQRGAVHHAICHSLSLIWGPPGTGKTKVVGNLVAELRAQEESILVVAPTHRTADLVALSILDHMEGRGLHTIGRVVRWGTVQLPQLQTLEGTRSPLLDGPGLRVFRGDDRDATMHAVGRADVVVTTLAKTHIGWGIPRRFDAVLVDEGGMALFPAVAVAVSHAKMRAVVVGDPHQLGPIVHAGTSRTREWLRRSAFEVVAASPKRGAIARPKVLGLTEQFRMDPAINDLVSALSYKGRLESATATMGREPYRCGLGSSPLVLIDTSQIVNGFEGHNENPVHARVIAAAVDLLRPESGEDQDEDDVSIAVVARYRAQVRQIIRCLRRNVSATGVTVSTVHAYQGGEAGSVVLDLTASPGARLGDYLVDGNPTDDGARVLTVALSRARRRLVVVANLRFLMLPDVLPKNSMARALLERLIRDGQVLPAEQVFRLHAYAQRYQGDAPTAA